jgi:ppGpp synthetase/RelA/SpoT-type nucleotidyltranferase
VPAQVVEEIITKTVDDTKVQFKVRLPDEKETTVVLETLNASIFNDIESLRNHMIENSKKSIEVLLSKAVDLKNNIFTPEFSDITSDARGREVMELFEKKVEKINNIKNKSKDMQIVANPSIINSDKNTKKQKQKEAK